MDITKYLPLVRQLANKLTHRRGWTLDKDDLVQEGMIRLMERQDSYDPSKSREKQWAWAVAEQGMIDYLRREVRSWGHVDTVGDDQFSVGVTAEEFLDYLHSQNSDYDPHDDETYFTVEHEIGRLPASLRRPLSMALRGYTVREIADEIGISKSQVSRLTETAKGRISRSLGQN